MEALECITHLREEQMNRIRCVIPHAENEGGGWDTASAAGRAQAQPSDMYCLSSAAVLATKENAGVKKK